MSNTELNKLKSGTKNWTEIILYLSSNVISDSNTETNFPHKLLLTDTQVLRLHKALQIIHQLIKYYQKLNYLKWYN